MNEKFSSRHQQFITLESGFVIHFSRFLSSTEIYHQLYQIRTVKVRVAAEYVKRLTGWMCPLRISHFVHIFFSPREELFIKYQRVFLYQREIFASHHVALAFVFQTMKMIWSAARFSSNEFETQTFTHSTALFSFPPFLLLRSIVSRYVCAFIRRNCSFSKPFFQLSPLAVLRWRRRRRALLSMLDGTPSTLELRSHKINFYRSSGREKALVSPTSSLSLPAPARSPSGMCLRDHWKWTPRFV